MKPLEEMGKFKTVVVDPPWPLKGLGFKPNPSMNHWSAKNINLPYESMGIYQIKQLPVRDIMLADSRLFLWATNGHIKDDLHVHGNMGGQVFYLHVLD